MEAWLGLIGRRVFWEGGGREIVSRLFSIPMEGKDSFLFFFTNKIFTRSIRSTRNVIWGGITIQFLKFDPFDENRGGYFPILEAGRTYIMQSYVNNAGFARGGGRGGGRNRWTIFPRVLKSQVLRARLLHARSNVTYELFNALSIN